MQGSGLQQVCAKCGYGDQSGAFLCPKCGHLFGMAGGAGRQACLGPGGAASTAKSTMPTDAPPAPWRPPAQSASACPICGYASESNAVSCAMCGHTLRKEAPRSVESPRPPEPRARRQPLDHEGVPSALLKPVKGVVRHEPEPPILGLPRSVFFVIVGAVLAPVFTFTPFLQLMGWFLSALVHEMGHTVAALLMGCSAVPAIRLDGHAMTEHGRQVMILAIATWAALPLLAFKLRRARVWLIGFGLATLVYPALAFTSAKEVVHLLGGHVGELAFAAVFLWRALSGGFTHSHSERALYAVCGWYFVGTNVWLCGGLIWNAQIQHWYAQSGSFGLTNDYIRLADHLGLTLPMVSGMMLGVSLLTVPAVLVAWWLRRP